MIQAKLLKKCWLLTLMLLWSIDGFPSSGASIKIVEGLDNAELRQKMEENLMNMVDDFQKAADEQSKSVKLSKSYMTADAIDDVKLIWKSSAMSCPPMNLKCRCLHTSTGYQVRGIPVDMVEADENERRQELTIDFTPQGIISNISISIDLHRYEELMAEQTSDIDYARRQIIVNFVENFRTAYNRRDLKLINSIFSDKALIITGKMVMEKVNTDTDRMSRLQSKVVYIKHTKQEYLKRLQNIFRSVKYLNVKFDDIEIVQHPKYDDIYGVTLKQYWHSSTYSDEGYLFLMVDFHDTDNPLIQVRTWQPYKNNKGEVVTKRDDVFHLGSFNIVR